MCSDREEGSCQGAAAKSGLQRGRSWMLSRGKGEDQKVLADLLGHPPQRPSPQVCRVQGPLALEFR